MKRIITFYLLLFISLSFPYAQILSGKVYDANTKKPISDADVYFDGTSINTRTDKDGSFRLPAYTIINTNLVISHLSYETVAYPSPFDKVPEIIYLKEKTHTLPEVTVATDQFSREKKLKVFREFFLGRDKISKSCTILNEDDIYLSYNGVNKTLTASIFKPLIIKNDYLAYEITFDLMHFTIEYNLENTLSKDYIRKSYFAGTSAFNDISVQGDKKIEKRRKEVYEGSPNRFYKNLTNNTLKESKYRVFRNSYETNPERCFAIKDTLSMKMLTVIPDESFNLNQRIVILDSKKIPPRPSRVSVLDNKKRQSDIVFHIDKILIDTFGNISSPDKVFYSGEWSDYKLGRMLPLEYDPEK